MSGFDVIMNQDKVKEVLRLNSSRNMYLPSTRRRICGRSKIAVTMVSSKNICV